MMVTKKNLRAIKAVSKRKAFKAKKKALKKYSLANWPPSRGPMPKWMTAKWQYIIPEVQVELVEWAVNKNGTSTCMAATQPKRVVTPALPGNKRGPAKMVIGKLYKVTDLCAARNTQRKWSLSLNQSVEMMTTLLPEQWNLIGGATLGRRASAASSRGGRAYATLESSLPDDKAIIVDLSYPLNKIARVTVKPYQTKFRGSDGKMHTVGPHMSLGYLLWALARAYLKVYEQHEAYGVWGHSIGDLVFEQLTIEDNIGTVAIGS
jgi:hypothetical protein